MANSPVRSMSDRELWACAHKVMGTHEADAELYAAMRADALLEAGDVAGQRVWMAILQRIEHWRSDVRPCTIQ